jgi:hypothetical protein
LFDFSGQVEVRGIFRALGKVNGAVFDQRKLLESASLCEMAASYGLGISR